MAGYIIGRLYGWQEFADEGQDVWLIHIDDPVFFMRVIEAPDDEFASGDIEDLAFPLETEPHLVEAEPHPEAEPDLVERVPRLALGNLTFFEPRTVDPRELATLVAGAIEAIHDDRIHRLIGLEERPFDPPSLTIWPEDIPKGFVVGALYVVDEEELAASGAAGEFQDARPQGHGEAVEGELWLAHIGMPPFLMKLCDVNVEDVENEDLWATVDSEHVLSDLQWLSSMSCDRNELRVIAEDAAAHIRDIVEEQSGEAD